MPGVRYPKSWVSDAVRNCRKWELGREFIAPHPVVSNKRTSESNCVSEMASGSSQTGCGCRRKLSMLWWERRWLSGVNGLFLCTHTKKKLRQAFRGTCYLERSKVMWSPSALFWWSGYAVICLIWRCWNAWLWLVDYIWIYGFLGAQVGYPCKT